MNVTLEPVDYLNHPNSSFKKDKLNLKDFDLINNNLPPNTGPPGTVSVNANNGNNNKNLSHVPCKFFRQGICQAGDSCPFSHNLEGSLGADKLPCKYFQKGNCKFGLKCALAHYLPDGTRVNSKSYGRKYYNNNGFNNGINNNNGNNNSSNGNGNNHFNYNVPPPNSQPIDISSSMRSSISLDTAGLSSQNLNTWSNGSNFTFNNPVNSNSFNQGPISLTAPSSAISNNYNTSPTGGIFSNVSNNTSPTTFYNSSPSSNFFSNNQLMSPNGNSQFINISGNFPPSSSSFGKPTFGSYLQESLQESPVIEEDKKTDDIFEEDYVPASLGDIILTPQELQRRDSRSQSGTLFIRPNLNNEKINDDVFLMD